MVKLNQTEMKHGSQYDSKQGRQIKIELKKFKCKSWMWSLFNWIFFLVAFCSWVSCSGSCVIHKYAPSWERTITFLTDSRYNLPFVFLDPCTQCSFWSQQLSIKFCEQEGTLWRETDLSSNADFVLHHLGVTDSPLTKGDSSYLPHGMMDIKWENV